MFLPMAEEQNLRAPNGPGTGKSETLEPVKSVATRVQEEKELEKRLFMRSYNPYVEGVYPHPVSHPSPLACDTVCPAGSHFPHPAPTVCTELCAGVPCA